MLCFALPDRLLFQACLLIGVHNDLRERQAPNIVLRKWISVAVFPVIWVHRCWLVWCLRRWRSPSCHFWIISKTIPLNLCWKEQVTALRLGKRIRVKYPFIHIRSYMYFFPRSYSLVRLFARSCSFANMVHRIICRGLCCSQHWIGQLNLLLCLFAAQILKLFFSSVTFHR